MPVILALTLWVAGAPLVFAAAPGSKNFHMSALVAIVEGEAEIQAAGSWEVFPAKAGMPVAEWSSIRTKANGRLTLMFTDGTKIRLGPNSSFKLEEAKPSKISVYIGLGRMESWVKKFTRRSFTARNPVAVASVRGTDFVMDVVSLTEVMMALFSGSMDVTDTFGMMTSMVEGQRMDATAGLGSAPPVPLPPEVKMDAPPPAPPDIMKAVMAAAGGFLPPPPGAPPGAPGGPKPGAPAGEPPKVPPGTLPPGTMPPPPLEVPLQPLPGDSLFGDPSLLPPPNVNQETSILSPSAPPPPPPP